MFKLKELRKNQNLTLKELSSNLNISYQALSNYENSNREPDFDTLIKIADFFDVSIDFLLGKTDNKYVLPNALTDQEAHLLKSFNSLFPKMQDFILQTVDNLLDKQT